ncbi:MAG TPA: nitroreductase/quinone reductase family protein [Thermomicrobiales bacterium]|jgi:hypothetical protein|nr:nitroreductase/quinone reductase family protein [Thermomicrobiales bacterium]
MDRQDSRPLWLTLMNRVVNPVVRLILRSPLHPLLSRYLLLLTVTGRATGRSWTLPLQYAERDGAAWIVPGNPAHKRWWRNLNDDASATLTIRGKSYIGIGEALTGAAADAARPGLAGSPLEGLARRSGNSVIVRVHDLRPIGSIERR